jgi:uncharacterized protein YecE (DUF72 family)
LPKEHRYVVEARNNKLLNDRFYSILRDNNVALAWIDNPSMPRITEATSDFIYVRWEGDRKLVNGALGKKEVDKTTNTKLWADSLRRILLEKPQPKAVFGYFSKYYSGHPPSDAKDLLDNLKTEKLTK